MRLPAALPALFLLTACLESEEETWRFDLEAKTGELSFRDLRARDEAPETALAALIVDFVQGQQIEGEHPGWRDVHKELVEVDGRLDGRLRFRFEAPDQAGLYQHDKKSPWIWCSQDRSDHILRTNGQDISAVLPGCVAWDRKARVLEVTLADPPAEGASAPLGLLPAWKRWQADGAPADIRSWPPFVAASQAAQEAGEAGEAAPVPAPAP